MIRSPCVFDVVHSAMQSGTPLVVVPGPSGIGPRLGRDCTGGSAFAGRDLAILGRGGGIAGARARYPDTGRRPGTGARGGDCGDGRPGPTAGRRAASGRPGQLRRAGPHGRPVVVGRARARRQARVVGRHHRLPRGGRPVGDRAGGDRADRYRAGRDLHRRTRWSTRWNRCPRWRAATASPATRPTSSRCGCRPSTTCICCSAGCAPSPGWPGPAPPWCCRPGSRAARNPVPTGGHLTTPDHTSGHVRFDEPRSAPARLGWTGEQPVEHAFRRPVPAGPSRSRPPPVLPALLVFTALRIGLIAVLTGRC